ncbi:MAG: 2-hydroxyacid dehydrogenase [Patescibacteria group bacterium]
MKIVIPEGIDIISKPCFKKISELGETVIYDDFPKTDEEVIKRIKNAEIVISKIIRLNANILMQCPRLKYIIILSVGINFIDIKKATELGIKIVNCPTHNSQAVAEHVFALLFSLFRNVVEAQLRIRNKGWRNTPYEFIGTELKYKRMGLIGHGQIGKIVEGMAKALGMTVSFVNSKNSDQEIDNLMKESDIVSIHVNSTSKTVHMINSRRLGLMKKTAYLINTSRGEIVDMQALYKMLQNKLIAGAGLDVFENEPFRCSPSERIIGLACLPNVIATPHIGFNTVETGIRGGEEIISNLKAIISGSPINIKN